MSLGNKFAHLLGISASEDDEEKKSRRAEEEEQEEHADEEDEDKDKEPKSKKSKKAEDESDDTSAEEDDSSDDEEDEDQDDEPEKESAAVKKGRKAENKRCAAIFASPHAARNVGLAAHLAFETRMSASQAINTMKMARQSAAPVSMGSRLDQRMAAIKLPNIGQDAPSKGMSAADKMKAVYDKAHKHNRGEK